MSYVVAGPGALAAAAADLAGIGSAIDASNTGAAQQTAGVPAAAADQVSAVVAAFWGAHAQGYLQISAAMSAVHEQAGAAAGRRGCQLRRRRRRRGRAAAGPAQLGQPGDLDVHVEVGGAHPGVDTLQRRHVGVVAADAHADVLLGDVGVVGGVVIPPAARPGLNPGVAAALDSLADRRLGVWDAGIRTRIAREFPCCATRSMSGARSPGTRPYPAPAHQAPTSALRWCPAGSPARCAPTGPRPPPPPAGRGSS